MKNLYTYLLLNKISCNTDITNNFNMKDLLLPSASFLTIFGLTFFVSILIYNNSFDSSKELINKSDTIEESKELLNQLGIVEESKELIKKLNAPEESKELVYSKCHKHLDRIENVVGYTRKKICLIENSINNEINDNMNKSINNHVSNLINNIKTDSKLVNNTSLELEIFYKRSVTYNNKGITDYLTGLDKNNLPFIKAEDVNTDVCEGLVEVEAYLNMGKEIRSNKQVLNKDYMFFFENQKIIAENIDQKKHLYGLFKSSFLEEAQYQLLQYKGEAVFYLIEHGVYLV